MTRCNSHPRPPIRKLALRTACAFGFAGLHASLALAQPATNASRIDSMFSRWHNPDSPGAAVLVMQNGEVVFSKGYGMANIEQDVPIRPNSVFDIASVSKQFCAMSIALLEAEGKLSLNDDVRKYVPELANFGKTITINHLIHHTSGLRDWPGALRIGGWNFEDVMSYDQILRFAFQQRELNFDPGSEYTYSNTGYNILALVVARVSGMSFRQFTEQRIFKPLGMTSTQFHDDHDALIRNRAESYRPGPANSVMYVPNNLTALGSSSLFTTVEDLARWSRNYEEPIVGNAAIIRRLSERGILNNGDTIAYAFGQSVETYRGLKRVSHTGSWAGYRTVLQRFPDQRFAVIILANTSAINPTPFATRISELYLGDRMSAVVASTPVSPPTRTPYTPTATDLAQYVGRYESDELSTFWTMSVQNGRLVANHFRIGDSQLQPLARDTLQSGVFGLLVFTRDKKGAVESFTANAERVRNLRFRKVNVKK